MTSEEYKQIIIEMVNKIKDKRGLSRILRLAKYIYLWEPK